MRLKKRDWGNVGLLIGTPLPNTSGITGVMLWCYFLPYLMNILMKVLQIDLLKTVYVTVSKTMFADRNIYYFYVNTHKFSHKNQITTNFYVFP